MSVSYLKLNISKNIEINKCFRFINFKKSIFSSRIHE